MSGLAVRNGEAFPLGGVPVGPPDSIHAVLRFRRSAGDRLIAFFGAPAPMPDCVRCFAVTADDKNSLLRVCAFDVLVKDGSFPSLTPTWTAAHLFEREIAEQFGIRPDGHPWLKPVRGAAPLSGPDLFEPLPGANTRLDAYRFLESMSEEVHEVGVGPVHAGIIEPGHFRFLCHGEKVLHLEISLGYQHRGVERRLIGGPDRRSHVVAESIAGDTVIGHALNYCRAIEGLAGMRVSARAMTLRGIALELERCSNHVGDLGALANDVGFLPGAAWFGRLRGEFLNMLMDLSGNRYGRGLLRPGGVGFDLGPDIVARFVARLEQARKDFAAISEILFTKPSVRGRFEGTGVLPRDVADDLGMVGPAARASGCERDARLDFPDGVYRFAHIPLAVVEGGDVAARAQVRRLETERSIAFLLDSLQHLPQGELAAATAPPLAPDSGCIVLTEAWRGECVHAVLTDHAGRFARYKVIDPSFRNWSGLAMALRREEISDFPLCNKSFNLSYAGHDL